MTTQPLDTPDSIVAQREVGSIVRRSRTGSTIIFNGAAAVFITALSRPEPRKDSS